MPLQVHITFSSEAKRWFTLLFELNVIDMVWRMMSKMTLTLDIFEVVILAEMPFPEYP